MHSIALRCCWFDFHLEFEPLSRKPGGRPWVGRAQTRTAGAAKNVSPWPSVESLPRYCGLRRRRDRKLARFDGDHRPGEGISRRVAVGLRGCMPRHGAGNRGDRRRLHPAARSAYQLGRWVPPGVDREGEGRAVFCRSHAYGSAQGECCPPERRAV